MGVVASALIPPCVVGTGVCLLHGKFSLLFGCLVPLACCELAHAVTDEALQSKGALSVDDAITDAAHWSIIQFGIRSYSLNCCGRWNHVLDVVRRCMAPCSASFSGRMIHDVVVASIRDGETMSQAFMILAKAHNGDLEIKFCENLDEVDIKAKPAIFGTPRNGWRRMSTESQSLKVQDLVDECSSIPPEYQPVSNNCHHLSKELWNWHAKILNQEGRRERLIRMPRGRCRPRSLPHLAELQKTIEA